MLFEWGLHDGIDPMDPSFPDENYERAEEMAITDFNADYFVESPEMQDTIGGRDPHDPEENELTKDEIVSALASYLRHYIETYITAFDGAYNTDTEGLVPAVSDKTVAALQQLGFVIEEAHLTEMIEGEELTIEDVLLPSPNKGVDLRGEVTKADITDPDDPTAHGKPDGAYTSRLLTLAGMRGDAPNV